MNAESQRRVLIFGALLEWAAAAATASGLAPDVHILAGDKEKNDPAMKRLMVLFLVILGASRAACASSRTRSTWQLTLLIHVAEALYFWREAAERAKEGKLDAVRRAFCLILLGIPSSLLIVGPSD